MGDGRRTKIKRRIKRKARTGRQCAALPFRRDDDGAVQVLLVTSRETRRWVLPKGWMSSKLTSAQAAAREAYEEGGVLGRIIGKQPTGTYRYLKRLTPDRSISCEVLVFPMEVRGQAETWPERDQREIRWVTPSQAADLVDEEGLAEILRSETVAKLAPSTRGAPGRTKRGRRPDRSKSKAAGKQDPAID